MANFLWSTPGSADTLVTGANMNGVTDGSGKIGAEIDNSSDRKTHMEIWLKVDTDITVSASDARFDFYLIAASDGTNYPDPPGTTTAADVPESYYVGSMSSLKRGGSATNFTSGQLTIQIPPRKFRIIVFNELGATLPANNNTLLYGYRFNLADA